MAYLTSKGSDRCVTNAVGNAVEFDFSDASWQFSVDSLEAVACSKVLCLVLHILHAPEVHLLAACDVDRKQLRQIFNLRISTFLREIVRSRNSLQLYIE